MKFLSQFNNLKTLFEKHSVRQNNSLFNEPIIDYVHIEKIF